MQRRNLLTSHPECIGSVICDLCVALSVLITIWCTFDRAGRSWVKMTRFQRSMKEGETKYHYKRSGNHRPNWRQRYVSFHTTVAFSSLSQNDCFRQQL